MYSNVLLCTLMYSNKNGVAKLNERNDIILENNDNMYVFCKF